MEDEERLEEVVEVREVDDVVEDEERLEEVVEVREVDNVVEDEECVEEVVEDEVRDEDEVVEVAAVLVLLVVVLETPPIAAFIKLRKGLQSWPTCIYVAGSSVK